MEKPGGQGYEGWTAPQPDRTHVPVDQLPNGVIGAKDNGDGTWDLSKAGLTGQAMLDQLSGSQEQK